MSNFAAGTVPTWTVSMCSQVVVQLDTVTGTMFFLDMSNLAPTTGANTPVTGSTVRDPIRMGTNPGNHSNRTESWHHHTGLI